MFCFIITVVKCGEKSQRYDVIYKSTSKELYVNVNYGAKLT